MVRALVKVGEGTRCQCVPKAAVDPRGSGQGHLLGAECPVPLLWSPLGASRWFQLLAC